MERRYADEPVPSVRRSTHADDLVDPADVDATDTTGTGTVDVPFAGSPMPAAGSEQYHRAPLGVMLSLPPQQPTMGAEVKQSGAGRGFVPATLAFPEQSVTPEPVRSRIARPMPTAARDDGDVIRPGGTGDG